MNKTDKTNQVIYVVIALIVIGLFYFAYRQSDTAPDTTETEVTTQVDAETSASTDSVQ